MARKEIHNMLDRENRNNINHNFIELYDGVEDLTGSFSGVIEDIENNLQDLIDDLKTDINNYYADFLTEQDEEWVV